MQHKGKAIRRVRKVLMLAFPACYVACYRHLPNKSLIEVYAHLLAAGACRVLR